MGGMNTATSYTSERERETEREGGRLVKRDNCSHHEVWTQSLTCVPKSAPGTPSS